MNPFSRLWRRLTLRSGGAWRAYFGGGSAAGENVTVDSALLLSAAWSCIRLRAQTIGSLSVGFYERKSDAQGGRVEAHDHEVAELLRESPNADQTPMEFLEGLVGCLDLRGNFYARKAMSGRRVTALETMFPDSTTLRREGGRIVYDWIDPDGRRVTLPEEEVYHVKGWGLGGATGLSTIEFARETFGSALAAQKSAGGIFASGMQQAGFLQSDAELTPPQRDQLQKVMDEFHGSKKPGKMMILEAGLKYQALSLKPDDAQLLATRQWDVEEICRWFQVPPIMIGHASQGQTMWGSGVEQIMLAWLTTGLRPTLVRIEQATKKRLLRPEDRKRFYPEFNVESLLRADSAGRAALYSSATQNGWMTRDEVRRRENLPAVGQAGGGDMLTAQANLVPLALLGQSPAADVQARAAFRTWLGVEDGNPFATPDPVH